MSNDWIVYRCSYLVPRWFLLVQPRCAIEWETISFRRQFRSQPASIHAYPHTCYYSAYIHTYIMVYTFSLHIYTHSYIQHCEPEVAVRKWVRSEQKSIVTSAQPMAARSPAPPAPTTTAAYSWSTTYSHGMVDNLLSISISINNVTW